MTKVQGKVIFWQRSEGMVGITERKENYIYIYKMYFSKIKSECIRKWRDKATELAQTASFFPF